MTTVHREAASRSEASRPLLEARGLSKRFIGIAALREASFSVDPGEVVCLLGDNGAGKSTLIKLLAGVHRPTQGDLYLEGTRVVFDSPRAAQAAGISTVHQDVGTLPLLSVARNFFLGVEPTKWWGPFRRIDHGKASRVALRELRAVGIDLRDGSQLVGTMSGGERQALSISRAMYFGARILLLDEPTSNLGVKESELVLRLIQRVRAQGVAVVLITHNVHHAMLVGDRYVVLIHGAVAADFRRGEKSRGEIIDLMAGGEQFQSLASELEEVQLEQRPAVE